MTDPLSREEREKILFNARRRFIAAEASLTRILYGDPILRPYEKDARAIQIRRTEVHEALLAFQAALHDKCGYRRSMEDIAPCAGWRRGPATTTTGAHRWLINEED